MNTIINSPPSVKWATLSVLGCLLSGCSTLAFLPGIDRIINAESSASVGPLVRQSDGATVAPADEDFFEPTESPEPPAAAVPPEATSATIAQAPVEAPVSIPPASSLGSTAITKEPPAAEPEPESPQAPPITQAAPEPAVPKPQAIPKPEPKAITVNLAGQITVLDIEGKPVSAEGGLVRLFRLDGPTSAGKTTTPAEAASTQEHRIDMQDKIYQPRFVVVNQSDTLTFVNKDPIKHNVFSSSSGNAFDLGTYGPDLQRSVRLQQPGIVKVYCNIHAEMATFIAVGEAGLATQTNTDGYYTLKNVPPGRYRLHIWHLRGEHSTEINVTTSASELATITIQTSAQPAEGHKNKFGENYAKNAKLFEDEFY